MAKRWICTALMLFAVSAVAVAQKDAADAKRDAEWRQKIRAALHVPAALPPLQAKTWSRFAVAKGVTAERVTYNTADGMIVPAIVYMPNPMPKTKLPGVVVVNGHGSDKFGWYAFWSGIEFARAGAVVVTYDPIGEGERNGEKRSQAGSHDALPLPYGTRLAGLMQTDLMQAVTLLTQRKDVDAKRIAVVGYSMGAFVSGIAGAIDPRIHAVVLSGGGNYGGPGSYFDRGTRPCQMPPYHALAGVAGAEMRGNVLWALNADHGPTLVMNGMQDTVMDIPHFGPEWFAALREQTIKLHGSEQNVFTTVFYPGVSHRPSWVNRDGFLWLDEQIHFANWSHAQIEKAPLTHISEWLKANDVFIAKNYMPEDREGGLMAVGTDVPGVKREDLMALPAAEWEKLKDRLTYEAWAAKVMTLYPAEAVVAVDGVPQGLKPGSVVR
ncbi:MAG: alpha/beta fold hydrolase [Acidobacteriaceae bacterium]|nr:alpha/beta fold hydrolase [Acidobacteriaceae bacterium]